MRGIEMRGFKSIEECEVIEGFEDIGEERDEEKIKIVIGKEGEYKKFNLINNDG